MDMVPTNLLLNQNIIITGINGLLGKSLAEYCVLAGANVIGVDLSAKTNNSFKTFQCNICHPEEIDQLLSKLQDSPPTGWVNAAYPRTEDWGKEDIYSASSWTKNIEMQLSSVCQINEKVGALMKNQRIGSIVNLASIYGILGPQFDIYKNTSMSMPSPYAAIKGGIINFTRFMAAKMGPYNIRVNCVSPGGIEDGQPKNFIEQYSEKTMLKRMGTPEDISACIAFLLSDQSTYITGQNLVVDGGWSSM